MHSKSKNGEGDPAVTDFIPFSSSSSSLFYDALKGYSTKNRSNKISATRISKLINENSLRKVEDLDDQAVTRGRKRKFNVFKDRDMMVEPEHMYTPLTPISNTQKVSNFMTKPSEYPVANLSGSGSSISQAAVSPRISLSEITKKSKNLSNIMSNEKLPVVPKEIFANKLSTLLPKIVNEVAYFKTEQDIENGDSLLPIDNFNGKNRETVIPAYINSNYPVFQLENSLSRQLFKDVQSVTSWYNAKNFNHIEVPTDQFLSTHKPTHLIRSLQKINSFLYVARIVDMKDFKVETVILNKVRDNIHHSKVFQDIGSLCFKEIYLGSGKKLIEKSDQDNIFIYSKWKIFL
ncbi:hypothetical protein PACTADRAFT_47490 [Pachysolen tannophilus NRRL Y-2460]|uniref:Uncharacterized protein n=1 Tax=Pachysolen tannophilus NRRL Y-2460 TaxID=669874 RepID=A0A1E4U0T1_PACTA|nr:hypothetical protein PACTADRAFT_47490 [Pachysolen tannophilus NRRL Y-2460]